MVSFFFFLKARLRVVLSDKSSLTKSYHVRIAVDSTAPARKRVRETTQDHTLLTSKSLLLIAVLAKSAHCESKQLKHRK